MTKQAFSASVKEDLNRLHTVTLTEGQIATILYVMEGAIQGNDEYNDDEDNQFAKDVESVFETLEGKIDEFYNSCDS